MKIIEHHHFTQTNKTVFILDEPMPDLIARGYSVIIDGQIYPFLFDLKRDDWFAVDGIVTPKNKEIEFTNV